MKVIYKRSSKVEDFNNNANTKLQPQFHNTPGQPQNKLPRPSDPDDDTTVDWRDRKFHFEVERDYSGILNNNVTSIRFSAEFPQQLNGSVPEEVFTNTIEGINALFKDAESISWETTWESILWYCTCTLMRCCRKTRLEKAILNIVPFIYEQNDKIYHPIGLHIVHPIARNLHAIGIRNISHYPLYSDNVNTANMENTNCLNSSNSSQEPLPSRPRRVTEKEEDDLHRRGMTFWEGSRVCQAGQ